MQGFTLDSGAKLEVTESSFAEAYALEKALISAVKETNLTGLKITKDIFDMDIDVMARSVLVMATSTEVEQCMFKCFERATYDGLRITRGLFDDPKIGPKIREDFYEICLKVAEVNCRPFLKRVFSVLKGFLQTLNGAPKQKSESNSPKS
jgi:hypothetical protein